MSLSSRSDSRAGNERSRPTKSGRLSAERLQLDEPVVGDPDERRGEHGHERLVVVAVVQEPQVGEQVDHLLLVVVVAARRPERRQAELAERLLVEASVRARCEEEDDLARSRLARVDELLDPGRDMLSLSVAPVDARVLVGRLVGDEQLDRRAERGILEAPRRGERLERVAEVRGEQVVDHLQHLRPRAVVLGQREDAAGGLAPLAEDLDVRVPEAVDGLELVSHEEQVLGREQVDQLALEPVRVLELVHQHRAEAPALALADLGLVAQQVPRGQLEVLEVERGLATPSPPHTRRRSGAAAPRAGRGRAQRARRGRPARPHAGPPRRTTHALACRRAA